MNYDFWSRQTNAQTERFEFAPFGMPVQITANRPAVLAAAQMSAGRFSRRATAHQAQPISIKIVVREQSTGPLPANLPERLVYSGLDAWLTVSAGAWGHAFANLQSREALLFLSPALAAETRLVSRYFVDHYLLNFILTDWAMLHASCVVSPDGEQLIAMVAPHNSGKSTTALHLLRAGYHFLADGMVLLQPADDGFDGGFEVGGYPTGEVKLRDDVLALFPEYRGHAVRVREQTKTVVDLRQRHPARLLETTIRPRTIALCFVERRSTPESGLEPVSKAEAETLLAGNSVYWDRPEQLAHNQAALAQLLEVATLHRLHLGVETEGIIAATDRLAGVG